MTTAYEDALDCECYLLDEYCFCEEGCECGCTDCDCEDWGMLSCICGGNCTCNSKDSDYEEGIKL